MLTSKRWDKSPCWANEKIPRFMMGKDLKDDDIPAFFPSENLPKGSRKSGTQIPIQKFNQRKTNWIFLFKISLGLLTWGSFLVGFVELGPCWGTLSDKTHQPNVTTKKKWWHFPQDGIRFCHTWPLFSELLQEGGGPPSYKVVLKKTANSLLNHGCKWV